MDFEIPEDDLLAEATKRFGGKIFSSLEDLVTSSEGFNIVTATPLQRAICRVADGKALGDLAKHPDVLAAMGDCYTLVGFKPAMILILAGIRTFKSVFAAAAAIWASQTCSMKRLGPGDIPRFSIISVNTDKAEVVMNHLKGAVMNSPTLAALLMKEPTVDRMTLRHPSGKAVEIQCVAGARAGANLVARYSAGAAYDEAPRMVGATDGVVNLDDALAAIAGRLLPGAQQFVIGSPWAPQGPVFELVQKHWKKPTKDLVVIRSRGDLLNPYWWTPEYIADLRRRNPVAYKTDFLAEFADPEENLIPHLVIQGAIDRENGIEDFPLKWQKGCDYVARMDPATRGNGWTLVIAGRFGGKKRVCGCWEWRGTPDEPLRPAAVLAEIHTYLRLYGLEWVYSDQWAADAFVDLADAEGFDIVIEEHGTAEMTKAYLDFAADMQAGNIIIPDHPTMLRDLVVLKKRSVANGIKIVLPLTPDGRHADYAPSLVGAMKRWLDEPRQEAPDPWGQDELKKAEIRRREGAFKKASAKMEAGKDREWWESATFEKENL